MNKKQKQLYMEIYEKCIDFINEIEESGIDSCDNDAIELYEEIANLKNIYEDMEYYFYESECEE